MGDKRNILYLNREKNIIYLEGKFIDLNLVTYIEDEGSSIILNMFNKSYLKIGRPELSYKDYSRENVPLGYNQNFNVKEIQEISKIIENERIFNRDFMSEFSLYKLKGLCEDSYFFYNISETEKKKAINLSNWVNLKIKIYNQWAGIKSEFNELVIKDENITKLILDYFKFNEDNDDILINLKKIFGYDYNTILNTLKLDDYIISDSGEIINL